MSIERGRCVGSQMCQNPKPCRDAFLLSCACFFRRRILIPAYLHPTYPTSFGFLIEAIEQDLLRPPGGDLFCFQVCFWALGAVAFTPHLLCKLGVWGFRSSFVDYISMVSCLGVSRFRAVGCFAGGQMLWQVPHAGVCSFRAFRYEVFVESCFRRY